MSTSTDFMVALNQLEKEKGIDKETIIEAIEAALVSACKKNFGNNQEVKVIVNRETGATEVFSQKECMEEVEDELTQISLENARNINPNYEIGDIVDIEVVPKDFGRIAAQTAKQVVVQKIREAERNILFGEFITKERELVIGTIQRKNKGNVIIGLGKIEAILPPTEQVPTEEYRINERIKVYVLEVKQTNRGPSITVSRTHPDLIKRLFELEVPEVRDSVVEIKAIAREAGSRTKIAVYSKNPDVDALGACVGTGGQRVNIIVSELHGEKIDIINYSDSPEEFIKSALSPSNVISVNLNKEGQSATIIVPDHQLSLAIGKEGQNARLAAKLTGWKIDIKNEKIESNFSEKLNTEKF